MVGFVSRFGVLAGLFFAVFALSPFVMATAQGGQAVGSVGSASIVGADGAYSTAIQAGAVYSLNLNVTSQTNYWAAVYGNVSGQVSLRSSANKSVFDWFQGTALVKNSTTQNIYSVVMASNKTTVPNWAATSAVRTGGSLDSLLGLTTTLSDSATNTFTGTFSTFIIGNASYASVSNEMAALRYWVNNASATGGVSANQNDTFFQTVSLNMGDTHLLFGTLARPFVTASNGSVFIFDNATQANYEMLLFVNNSGQTTATTYYFYVELR